VIPLVQIASHQVPGVPLLLSWSRPERSTSAQLIEVRCRCGWHEHAWVSYRIGVLRIVADGFLADRGPADKPEGVTTPRTARAWLSRCARHHLGTEEHWPNIGQQVRTD
jgi:hypothetical protein